MSEVIALIGMMGSGKTSVGRLLAEQTKTPFVDTDALAEAETGMSVAEIFRQLGEPAFRRIESQMLESAVQNLRGGGVLSTGGGVILSADNRLLLREKTFCVYLSTAATTLAERLSNAPDDDTAAAATRPLLFDNKTSESKEKTGTVTQPQTQPETQLEKLEKILQERRALYEDPAHLITWQSFADKPPAVAQQILHHYEIVQKATK